MRSDTIKRLFTAIYTEDITSLKKLSHTIIESEKQNGDQRLATALEAISKNDKQSYIGRKEKELSPLPKGRSDVLLDLVPREKLRHEMILPKYIENRILSIEDEYEKRDILSKYNLNPKKKILLYGSPGCGKTLCAERIAWKLELPLLKVRFDKLLSSYLGDSLRNLRNVFDYCKNERLVLLLDECDTISMSRTSDRDDVGEMHRVVNMMLTLLDEYDAPGLVIATTNIVGSLDKAFFRRFDDAINMPMPDITEIERLITKTLYDIPIKSEINVCEIAKTLEGRSCADVVTFVKHAAKYGILDGSNKIDKTCFEIESLDEIWRCFQ